MDPKTLPLAWYQQRDESLRRFGDQWLNAGRIVAMLVPSAAVLGEWNVLLNPAHPDFQSVKFGKPRRFDFNARMFR
jgi:RES domain-containing protein